MQNDEPSWVARGLPSPEETLEDAAEEAAEIDIGDYMSTILTLRDRGFSWRRIAQWFNRRGFDFNHIAIYRAYQEHKELQSIDQPNDEPNDNAEVEP